MAVKTVIIDGTEYLLTHVGQPTVNGRKCNQYEVRKELKGQDAYYQCSDIYVPAYRSVEDHMQGIFGKPDDDSDDGYPAWGDYYPA